MEGDSIISPHVPHLVISIHSLRMEGDPVSEVDAVLQSISIHSLRMEGDVDVAEGVKADTVFQSTPSAWRETWTLQRVSRLTRYFNPLPPHGGRQQSCSFWTQLVQFQSTPSTRRETQSGRHDHDRCHISIHSLHTEGDKFQFFALPKSMYFNPLPPHGGRRRNSAARTMPDTFQSTPSTRRETHFLTQIFTVALFQSTPSTRRETVFMRDMQEFYAISIHSLHTEGDYHRVARGK